MVDVIDALLVLLTCRMMTFVPTFVGTLCLHLYGDWCYGIQLNNI